MDELSIQELRSAAFAANLRRAFAAPPAADELPSPFAALLQRLGEVQTSRPSSPRDTYRLGA